MSALAVRRLSDQELADLLTAAEASFRQHDDGTYSGTYVQWDPEAIIALVEEVRTTRRVERRGS